MVKVEVPMPEKGKLNDVDEFEEDDDDEDDDPDWEEVKNDSDEDDEDFVPVSLANSTGGAAAAARNPRSRKRGIEDLDDATATIRIGGSDDDYDDDIDGKPKRRKLDFDELCRRRINKRLIEKQLCKHKMSLLMYLARGIRLVRTVKSEMVLALALSIVDNWLIDKSEPEQAKLEGKVSVTTTTTTSKKNKIEKASSKPKAKAGSRASSRLSKPSAKAISNNKKRNNKDDDDADDADVDDNINSDIVKLCSSNNKSRMSPIKGRSYRSEREYLQVFMNWFNEVITIGDDEQEAERHKNSPFMINIIDCFAKHTVTCLMELVIVFIACLKAARPEVPIRLLNILRPVTMRAEIIVKPDAKQPAPNLPKYSTEEKLDYWIEVYLNDEKRWICVDLCNCKLDEPNVLCELNKPFFYLVSFDVDRNCIKSAESNYCADWYTPSFKRERCDPKWWNSVLQFLGPSKQDEQRQLDSADEQRNQEILMAQDIPKSESAYKNHPLYVLQKHLLKFQGIYPAEVAPVGFFKNLPVYPRDCVHTLMSREKWLRNARSVKPNETPYKIVKARPKRDKYSKELVKDLPLELFGEWQTQDYDPPIAKNGKVPKNAYGNVDMYQECMLPKGCTWLKLNGLMRIANKLGIDCGAAVVGFDCNSGNFGSHPIIDGFIVCSEYAETLTLAWEEEQENARRKELEKQRKRIYDNWKSVIKGVLARERLKKYN